MPASVPSNPHPWLAGRTAALAILVMLGPVVLGPTPVLGAGVQTPQLDVEMTASPDGAGLDITASSMQGSGPVRIVVSYNDTIRGHVVNRVVDVEVEAGTEQRIELRDLHLDADLRVRVFGQDVDLPTLSDATHLLDGTLLDHVEPLVDLGTLSLPPLPGGEAHRVGGHPVTHNFTNPYPARLLVTSGAVLLAGWHDQSTYGAADGQRRLFLNASYDGGRTWAHQFVIGKLAAYGPDGQAAHWAMAEAADGWVDVVWRPAYRVHYEQPPALQHLRVEPELGMRTPSRTLGGHLAMVGDFDLVSGASGDVLLVGAATEHEGVQITGGGVSVWRVGPDGDVARAAQLGGQLRHTYKHLFADARGPYVVAAWSDTALGLAFATSRDGGATFSAPRAVEGLPHHTQGATPMSATVDAEGTVHIAIATRSTDDPSTGAPRSGAYHLRVPVDGDATLRVVDGPGGDALVPLSYGVMDEAGLAVHGTRVWATWVLTDEPQPDAFNEGSWSSRMETWLVESLDGGRTWLPPTRIEAEGAGSFRSVYDVAQFPDGRPVFFTEMRLPWGQSTATLPSVVPLFDPYPDAASGLVEVVTMALASDASPPVQDGVGASGGAGTTDGAHDAPGAMEEAPGGGAERGATQAAGDVEPSADASLPGIVFVLALLGSAAWRRARN